ncbi:hypothetical protein C900_01946 [Fulvivirga imtechensis AK7]|uniref:Uncharacterized protein n=1 Tax=Fulvivirga imtechensis AK7 TaxID=1237149 RepID=L8JSK3_9BACT|nr:hypothetical protein C900_01946 [Fulvivirga imtechensis AK7]
MDYDNRVPALSTPYLSTTAEAQRLINLQFLVHFQRHVLSLPIAEFMDSSLYLK